MMIDIDALNRLVPTDSNTYLADDGLLHCKLCHGYRQSRITVNGELKKVNCICDCMNKAREKHEQEIEAERISRNRSICFSQSLHEQTFEKDDRSNARVSDAMKKYADNFKTMLHGGMGLVLYGGVGTGKSYYAACIANEVINQGYRALMTNFAELTNRLWSMKTDKQDYINSLNLYQLLVIDDLGIERQKSEYMQEIVYNIIDSRYRSRKPLIITTNLTLEQLANTSDIGMKRIYDRILEQCHPVQVAGESRRKEKLVTNFQKMNELLGL